MRALLAPAILLALLGCGARTDLATATATVTASSDAGVPPPTDPACAGAPAEPLLLATVGEFSRYDKVTAMVVAGGALFYAVSDGGNDPLAIVRVPIGGGPVTEVVKGASGCEATSPFAYGPLATDGRLLYTNDEESIGCTGYAVRVTTIDVATGALGSLPFPPGVDAEPRSLFPKALRGGGAAWVVDPGTYTGPVVVAAWTGGPTSRVVATLPAWTTGFERVGDTGFAATIDKGTATLLAVPLAGGAPTALGTFGPKLSLHGANDDALFFTPDGTTLARRDAATGEVTTLAIPLPTHAFHVDRDHVYTDSVGQTPTSFPAVLTRVPAKGGAPEEVWRDDARNGIQAITTDACNVYWVAGPDYDASAPPAVFARRR
jgi:hypothetical protein